MLLLPGCAKEKPGYCAKLAPVPLSGSASQQGAQLAQALGALAMPGADGGGDPVAQQMTLVLRNIEKDTRKSFGPALARQLGDELVTAAKAFGKTVVYDCQEVKTQWEPEVKGLVAQLNKEAAENEQKKKDDEAKQVAAEKKGNEEQKASIEACRKAAIARPSGVALDTRHYSRSTGSGRGGLMFLRLEGGAWKNDPFQPSDEPGAVPSQIDYVMRQESKECRTMGDTDAAGKPVKVKVCGWQVDVVTCDLKTQTLLGSRRLSLEVPEELSVRGSIKASAERYLAQQLWLRVEKVNWR
jgi:hypothetical protein